MCVFNIFLVTRKATEPKIRLIRHIEVKLKIFLKENTNSIQIYTNTNLIIVCQGKSI